LLIIDDHDSVREGLELLLRRRGHKTFSAESGAKGLEILAEIGADLVITDLKMANVDGIEVVRAIRDHHTATDVLVMTGYGTIETAVEAIKLGAVDYIAKPFSSEEFGVRIERLLSERAARQRLQAEAGPVRKEVPEDDTEERYGEIVGESVPMQNVFRWIRRVAPSDSTVMVYGGSGTGKELVARAIHAGSSRKDGPFIRVNCGALSESLLDSELFGHERGAFTGAERRRRGRFELADGGTLFLDEIATISRATQVRLLRVLQERELERVGGEDTIPVDVRIIAATNATPDTLRDEHNFREDLFYRLHVVPITLPPLRDRREDVAPLVRHFVQKLRERTCSPVREVSDDALARLAAHDWPGNVRELENVVERALVLAEGERLELSDLPFLRVPRYPETPGMHGEDGGLIGDLPEAGADLNQMIEGLEERLVRQALQKANGVKAEAARLLGLKASALYYKLDKYGIEA